VRHCVFSSVKEWVTLPNIYNRFDVVLRVDHDPGYSFPVEEAQACGVPVIATSGGIDHLFTQAGGGILIEAPKEYIDLYGGGREYYINNQEEIGIKTREAIIWMRDHPKERKKMGEAGREEILKNWTWKKQIPKWRKFIREGYEKVTHSNSRQ
jgi:glycosyltransferase involved in cell wall biosynthesis